MCTLNEFSLNSSLLLATKLSRVPLSRPGAFGCGISCRMARACGDSRDVGITLLANCWPVSGS